MLYKLFDLLADLVLRWLAWLFEADYVSFAEAHSQQDREL